MERKRLPMNLQIFAEPGEGAGGQGAGGDGAGAGSQPPAIDYDKIAQILEGKQAATEESVLKGYFKQQGLSREEMEQAIGAFKQQKAANTPDIGLMQTQLTEAQTAVQQAQLKAAATMAAAELGMDAKKIPYMLRLADFSQVTGADGKINDEALKGALNKVLEDMPELKPKTEGSAGFVQVGAPGGGQGASAVDAELDRIFGTQKK